VRTFTFIVLAMIRSRTFRQRQKRTSHSLFEGLIHDGDRYNNSFTSEYHRPTYIESSRRASLVHNVFENGWQTVQPGLGIRGRMKPGHEVTIEIFTCPPRMMKGTVVTHDNDGIVVLLSNCFYLTFEYPSGEQVLTPIGEAGKARGERTLKGPIGRVVNWQYSNQFR